MSRKDQIEKAFTYYPPTLGQLERYIQIRNKAKELAFVIDGCVPDSREKSVALTELETVVMWANAGIARE